MEATTKATMKATTDFEHSLPNDRECWVASQMETTQNSKMQGSFTHDGHQYSNEYCVSPVETVNPTWAPDNMPSKPPQDCTSMRTSSAQDSTKSEVPFGYWRDSYPSPYELEAVSKKGFRNFFSRIFRRSKA